MKTQASLAFALTFTTGCSYYTSGHQAYTPLLDHAGQVDIAARGGVTTMAEGVGNIQAAYAPIDNLEVAGSVEVASGPDNQLHAGGGVAVGTFARHDVLRLEALAGVEGGYGTGRETVETHSFSGMPIPDRMDHSWNLSGGYVSPLVQVAIGFEVPHFELAVGSRVRGTFAEVSAQWLSGLNAPTEKGNLAYLSVDPFVTLRVPFDIFRVELLMGGNIPLAGDLSAYSEPLAVANLYTSLGFGVQFDTL
jgi:hypothetical protein